MSKLAPSMADQASLPAGVPPAALPSVGYQVLLVGLLSLNFGIVCFDRNALNYLMPFIKGDLELTNAQVGLLAGSLSLTWSVAAFGMGRLSDALGRRKMLLVVSTAAFACCSFLSGIASSFASLLMTRLLMGVAEGGVLPLSQTIVAADVSPRRLGLAQGIAQNVGSNFFGSVLAPIMLVGIAEAYGWRSSFFIAGAPGLLTAALILLLLREPRQAPRPPRAGVEFRSIDALKERNVLICIAIGILLVSYLVTCWVFVPLYLTEVRHFSRESSGWLLGTLGISATLGSFVVSALSDRIGRRPVIIAMALLSVAIPLLAMWGSDDVWLLGGLFLFFGWGVNGLMPLVAATVPIESVDPRHAATVLGLCAGAGELLGGSMAPLIGGLAADRFSLAAPLWIMAGTAVISGVVALGLRETAPSRVGSPRA